MELYPEKNSPTQSGWQWFTLILLIEVNVPKSEGGLGGNQGPDDGDEREQDVTGHSGTTVLGRIRGAPDDDTEDGGGEKQNQWQRQRRHQL